MTQADAPTAFVLHHEARPRFERRREKGGYASVVTCCRGDSHAS
jgi:hypothetical protein